MFHRFGVIYANQQPKVAQPSLEDKTIEPQKLVRDRHTRWYLVDAEAISVAQNSQEVSER